MFAVNLFLGTQCEVLLRKQLGTYWGNLGTNWGNLGTNWGNLGANWGSFGTTWCYLGLIEAARD